MKLGIGIPSLDREHMWTEIQDTLVCMSLEADEKVQQQPPLNDDVDEEEHRESDALHVMNEAADNILDELNDLYQAEKQRRNNHHHHHYNVQQLFEAVVERVIDAVIAQLTFSCSLRWWKNNEGKYKMISKLALHVLCIPDTSAPKE